MTDSALGSRTVTPDPILKMKLVECFEKLCKVNARYASIISLHFEGFNADEISSKIDVTVNNLYVLMSRARTMLKNCLDKGELS